MAPFSDLSTLFTVIFMCIRTGASCSVPSVLEEVAQRKARDNLQESGAEWRGCVDNVLKTCVRNAALRVWNRPFSLSPSLARRHVSLHYVDRKLGVETTRPDGPFEHRAP